MPTYSYRCRDCDVAFDIQQSFQEDTLTVCPKCEGRLRKIFNTVGVVFKGSGFYRTDSRDAGSKSTVASSSTKTDSSPSSSGSGSSGSGSGSSSSGSSSSGSAGSGSASSSSSTSSS
ncbi:FmdB family zinc ribbon protein [Rhodococcus sp. IEGM 1408]|uniref:FmdB family zinc ribbon protein n=1 Tax=Rhodococcus sp. IEGM 1408 TaxID=3082220 RepID=UPI002955BBCD|nr:FmdB family zinc ribbon protein [Rhodococcus sp. IEGM 1408]MDV8001118.1 FmdB family zinc ribbon protein [Rhodococcus sp. IEGM 1408]